MLAPHGAVRRFHRHIHAMTNPKPPTPQLSSRDDERVIALRQRIADAFLRLAEERAQIRQWQQELNALLQGRREP
jgi:hypothetical protein